MDLNIKEACCVCASENVNLESPGHHIDYYAMFFGGRFLAPYQTHQKDNGIYIYTGPESQAIRADDMPIGSDAAGAYTFIQNGSFADSGYVCSSDNALVGKDVLVFSEFSKYQVKENFNPVVQYYYPKCPLNYIRIDFVIGGDPEEKIGRKKIIDERISEQVAL